MEQWNILLILKDKLKIIKDPKNTKKKIPKQHLWDQGSIFLRYNITFCIGLD